MSIFRWGTNVRDDAGNAVPILGTAGMSEWPSKGDARIDHLVKRLRRVIWQASSLGSLAAFGCIVFVYLSFGVLRPLAVRFIPQVPGFVYLILGIVAIRLLIRTTWRTGLYLRRNHVAGLVLAEGLCPSCGYNFAGLKLEGRAPDDLVHCPECGGAWRRRRVVRVEPFNPALPLSLPTTLVRKRVSVPRWSTIDDRGVPVRLVHPRLSWYLLHADSPERRSRLRDTRRELAKNFRWLRVPMAAGTAGLGAWGAVALYREDPDTLPGAIVVLAIALAFAAAMLWGNFLYTPRYVRRVMLGHVLCPGCARDLRDLPVTGDGCVECTGCRAAWRVSSIET